ncbi:MAG: hypothetical protein ABI606_02425 [Rhodoferax sp.]
MKHFQSLVESAGISSATATRSLIEDLFAKANSLDLADFSVKVKFRSVEGNWGDPYFEFVGTVIAEIKVPASVQSVLPRLVFVLPEFWEFIGELARPVESFRIDNAHYLRVTPNRVNAQSSHTTRDVLSFRLIDNRWDGSLFVYRGTYPREVVEARVRDALTNHFRASVQLYMLGLLPPERLLTEAEYEKISSIDKDRFFEPR